MPIHSSLLPVSIGSSAKTQLPLGMGGSFYGMDEWTEQQEADVLAGLEVGLENGLTHIDTATGYGKGNSERLIGRFLAADPQRRDQVYLASKANLNEISAQSILDAIEGSRSRLQTDVIDLYYIHWPRTGKDLRPLMDGLETARQQGKIHQVGVSNFSVEQMEQLSSAGRIDAHQLGYNLLWRFPERDLIPYCIEQQIAIVVYSALAHGILAGKYERELNFVPGDQRWTIFLFRAEVWDQLYELVEELKTIAQEAQRPLPCLALRWLLEQPGITSVLVSAKNARQAQANVQTLEGEIRSEIFEALSRISAAALEKIPDEGNPFGYHP